MRNLVRQAMIAGTGALILLSAGGPAALVGQAHADNLPCAADAADPCPVDGSGEFASQPRSQTAAPETRVVCQPAGRFGAHCYRQELY